MLKDIKLMLNERITEGIVRDQLRHLGYFNNNHCRY